MQSPLSNSDSCLLLSTVNVSSLRHRWQIELGIDWIPQPGINQLQYWRDEITGLQFYSPVQSAGGADLYSQLQRFPWYYMEAKWEFSEALLHLKSLPDLSRVLEVGVGQGAFLEKARDAGLQIIGMELNPAGAQAARDKGFTVVEKDMAALYVEDQKSWDAICAFQVLEHLPQPRLFIEQAITLLKPGGLLILSVPNAAVARELDPEHNDLLDQPPHHMSHWDERVFRSLESLFPLRLRHVAFEPLAVYHINWFVGAWSQRLRSRIGQFGGKLVLNRFTIPIVQKALGLGLRQLVRGHTLFVCLEKTGSTMD